MRRLILFCVIVLASSSLLAQTARIGDVAYNAEYQRQINASEWTKYLYENADIFQQILHLRTCEALGIDPAGDDEDENNFSGQQAQSLDTSFVRDISNKSDGQNETTIGINRLNRNLIIAGANDQSMSSNGVGMPSYTSTDGGASWKMYRIKETGVSSPGAALGDPMIATDDSGYFYYAYLIAGIKVNTLNLVVATSKDGKTWKYNTPILKSATALEDKEHIIVDNSPQSPHHGRVYVAWARFLVDKTQDLFVVYSDDRCKTWSTPYKVTNGQIRFVQIRTGIKGEVFIAYNDLNDNVHHFARSFDGAAHFDNIPIAPFTDYPRSVILGRGALKGDYGFRAVPYMSFDVDQKSGKMHMLYGSFNDTASGNPAAIQSYATSADNGKTWTPGHPITTTSLPEVASIDQDRFLPWVSIDQKTSDVHSIYYTSELDADNILTTINHLQLTSALDNAPISLTGKTFDPLSVIWNGGPFVGDYIGCDANDSVFAACWTENRPPKFSDGDVFAYVSGPQQPKTGVRKVIISSKSVWLSPVTPNPVTNGKISVQYYFPKNTQAEFAIYDALGKKIGVLFNGMMQEGTSTSEFTLPTLSAGSYFIKLTSAVGVATEKLIVE